MKHTGRPGYLQVADDLRTRISDGRLKAGEALPTLDALTRRYGASLGVVKQALSVLKTEGLLIGQQGKAVYVASGPAGADQATAERLLDLESRVLQLERLVAELTATQGER